MSSTGKVVILDRDGTLVVDRGYLDDPAGLEFLPGAAEGLKLLSAGGFRLIVITNQSGVGRGLFPQARLEAMNERLHIMAHSAGAQLEAIYYCPHSPDDGCTCRKPAQGLLIRAAAELGFNPSSAIVIGDKESDIEFGFRAGAMTVLIADPAPPAPPRVRPDLIASNLLAAARMVTALRG